MNLNGMPRRQQAIFGALYEKYRAEAERKALTEAAKLYAVEHAEECRQAEARLAELEKQIPALAEAHAALKRTAGESFIVPENVRQAWSAYRKALKERESLKEMLK